MNSDEKIEQIRGLFIELLMNHEMEGLTVTLQGDRLVCIQARGERTILNLGTFAVAVQGILGL